MTLYPPLSTGSQQLSAQDVKHQNNQTKRYTLHIVAVKSVLNSHSKEYQKIGFQSMQVQSIAECSLLVHSAILLTCMKR